MRTSDVTGTPQAPPCSLEDAPEPVVSVVVLACNIAPYIEQCLRSLENQSFRAFEVIIVNDGSTDATGEFAHRVARQDRRMSVIDNPRNRGTFVSRCIGAERSRGEYLCMIDGDDWVAPTFLQEMLAAARRHDADVVECSAYGVRSDGRPRVVFRAESSPRDARGSDILRHALGRDIWHIAWSKMIDRRLYLRASPMLCAIDDHLVVADDKLFMLPILGFARHFVHIDRPLYRYRLRADSSTRLRNADADLRHILQTSLVDEHLRDMLATLGVAGEHARLIASNRDDEILIALRILDRYPVDDPTRRKLEGLLRSKYGSQVVESVARRRGRGSGRLLGLLRRYSWHTLARMAWRSARRAAGIALHRRIDRQPI